MFVKISSGDYVNTEHVVLMYAVGTGSNWSVQATVTEDAELTISGNVITLYGSWGSQALAQSAIQTAVSGVTL